MAGFDNPRRCAVLLVICACTTLPLLAHAKPRAASSKHRSDAPLHFDPPAAGHAPMANPGYDACIGQPSPDGAAIDCQALASGSTSARPKPHAQAQPRRHR